MHNVRIYLLGSHERVGGVEEKRVHQAVPTHIHIQPDGHEPAAASWFMLVLVLVLRSEGGQGRVHGQARPLARRWLRRRHGWMDSVCMYMDGVRVCVV
jgi:hypothetical protein